MKKTRIISVLICVVMLCMAFSPVSVAAENPVGTREGYVDIEIPFEESTGNRPRVALRSASSPLTGNGGKFNAFFPAGETEALTNVAIFDFCDDSIPMTAYITNVTVNSVRTSVPGMTYYVCIGRSTPDGDMWAPEILWNTSVSTSRFNGQDPWGYWGLDFYATRVITNPALDYGAGATVSSATLRIYYSY